MARLEMLENDIGIMQRGETYLFDAKFREEGAAATLTSGTMLITYPCETGSQSTSLVTTATSGRYEGTWDIPSSATYGEYVVSITGVYEGHTYKFVNSFYILPWNIAQQVRSVTGIKQSNDISDRDIAIVAWNAYLEAREKVFVTKLWEKFRVDSAHLINGSNKAFYVYNNNLVTDHLACDEVSIQGYYEDTNHDQWSLTVSITTGATGLISVADKNGNALTSDTSCDYWLIYRIKSQTFKEELFKKAVVYLTAHEVILRFNELDKATLSDLGSNKPIILANPDRMLKKYKATMKKISIPRVDGV